MTGPVELDTALMRATAQGSANIADSMITEARTLSAGLDFVHASWKGHAGDAFRAATQNQKALLEQLIQKLQLVSDTVRRGGEGFAGHEANARTKIEAQGQNFLQAPLNHS